MEFTEVIKSKSLAEDEFDFLDPVSDVTDWLVDDWFVIKEKKTNESFLLIFQRSRPKS